MLLYKDIIDADMLFYTFDDFMKVKDHIKEKLATLNDKDFIVYRMYIESRPWIKDLYRGVIWDYLNNYIDDEELRNEYRKYLLRYGDKHE